MKINTLTKLCLGLLLSLQALTVHALTVTEAAELFPDGDQASGGFGSNYQNYGNTLSLDGDTALIGDTTGAAYVFTRDSSGHWNQSAKLVSDDQSRGFGIAVAITGDTAIVGAHWDQEKGMAVGAVYVFTRNPSGQWHQTDKLLPDAGYYSYFGYSLAIDGDTLIVGAYGENGGKGAAYVFTRDSNGHWNRSAKLLPDPLDYDMGISVAIEGDTAIVGADGYKENILREGAANVYIRDANGIWHKQTKLLVPGSIWLGISVALDKDTALIGSRGNAAYIFIRDDEEQWHQQAVLHDDPRECFSYGNPVSLDNDKAIVATTWDWFGCRHNDETSGEVYLYSRDVNGAWSQSAILQTSTPESTLVGSVAIDNDVVFAGAKELTNTDMASVYVYNLYSFLTPQCNGQDATIYVSNRQIIGGPMDGQSYQSVLTGTRYGDDVIVGTNANDQIFGHGGNDTICGLKGDDSIYGSRGNDVILGGQGDDVLLGEDDDDVLKGEAGNDLIQGDNGNDDLDGGEGDDVLSGGDGNDVMRAYQGNDVLLGGGGTDRLDGGAGKDLLNGGWQYDVCIAGEVHARCEDIR